MDGRPFSVLLYLLDEYTETTKARTKVGKVKWDGWLFLFKQVHTFSLCAWILTQAGFWFCFVSKTCLAERVKEKIHRQRSFHQFVGFQMAPRAKVRTS